MHQGNLVRCPTVRCSAVPWWPAGRQNKLGTELYMSEHSSSFIPPHTYFLWDIQSHFPCVSLEEMLLSIAVLRVVNRQVWVSITTLRLWHHGSGQLWQCLRSTRCSSGIIFPGSLNFRAQQRYWSLEAGGCCWLPGLQWWSSYHGFHFMCQMHLAILS